MEMSFDEARRRILESVAPLEVAERELLAALGLVLAEDLVAPRDLPPHANAAMDGYAVSAADVAAASPAAPVRLPVAREIAAGSLPGGPLPSGTAARIMTGAPIPPGADAVVPFEQTDERERADRRSIGVHAGVSVGTNVRPAGEDARAGQVVLEEGTVLRPAHLGVAASLGRAIVRVHRAPRVAILSTGDELLAPGALPAAGRVYDANGAVLAAAALEAGAVPVPLGIAPDRPDALEGFLHRASAVADLIVTSAGVSHGDYDLVKEVLGRLGRIDFWSVRMRPGRPLAFGSLGGTPLVGLPGNPVAAAVGFEELVRPAIRKLLGAPLLFRPEIEALARGSAANRDGRRCFLRARVHRVGPDFIAVLNPRQGAGLLTALAWANALVLVPEEVPQVRDGDRVRAQLLDESALGHGAGGSPAP